MLQRLRLADITAPFRALVARLRNQRVYVSPKMKKTLPALTVYRQYDPAEDDGTDGYYFSERAGRDSVAFLLVDRGGSETLFGCLQQWHGPLARFVLGAFTGSLDKPGLSIETIVQEEAMEEAGYHVGLERIEYLGAEPVSSQCNEETHMFVVDVTGLPQQPLQPENPFEENTETHWLMGPQVLAHGEWKSKLIVLASGAIKAPTALTVCIRRHPTSIPRTSC
jgi:8-oxo-dGTP pyrophosphatase MutT (NUDIX family)